MLDRRGIQHRLKEGLNDIATIDRAGSTVKSMLAKRIGELSGDWLTHLEPVDAAYNKLDHAALRGNVPGEVEGDDELRFQLRVENANKRIENIERAQQRAEALDAKGGSEH